MKAITRLIRNSLTLILSIALLFTSVLSFPIKAHADGPKQITNVNLYLVDKDGKSISMSDIKPLSLTPSLSLDDNCIKVTGAQVSDITKRNYCWEKYDEESKKWIPFLADRLSDGVYRLCVSFVSDQGVVFSDNMTASINGVPCSVEFEETALREGSSIRLYTQNVSNTLLSVPVTSFSIISDTYPDNLNVKFGDTVEEYKWTTEDENSFRIYVKDFRWLKYNESTKEWVPFNKSKFTVGKFKYALEFFMFRESGSFADDILVTVNGKKWVVDSVIDDDVNNVVYVQASQKELEIKIGPVIQKHTVTYETNGGSTIIPVTVEHGKTASHPETPTKSGYKFGGWFTDASFTTEFDFNKGITEDTTIHARWYVEPVKVDMNDSSWRQNNSNVPITVTANKAVLQSSVTSTIAVYAKVEITFKKGAEGSTFTTMKDGAQANIKNKTKGKVELIGKNGSAITGIEGKKSVAESIVNNYVENQSRNNGAAGQNTATESSSQGQNKSVDSDKVAENTEVSFYDIVLENEDKNDPTKLVPVTDLADHAAIKVPLYTDNELINAPKVYSIHGDEILEYKQLDDEMAIQAVNKNSYYLGKDYLTIYADGFSVFMLVYITKPLEELAKESSNKPISYPSGGGSSVVKTETPAATPGPETPAAKYDAELSVVEDTILDITANPTKIISQITPGTVLNLGNSIRLSTARNTDGSTQTIINYSSGDSLPSNIMSAMKDSKNMTLVFTYEYQGKNYKVEITGEEAARYFDPTIPWYGPLWLDAHFH
ncbi:MAG: InlB B-repeat-containing protein [Lachnospiraceae bacterium]|nr:InlB B-repeat-containing protein [Lachnospiraceae bacterium]